MIAYFCGVKCTVHGHGQVGQGRGRWLSELREVLAGRALTWKTGLNRRSFLTGRQYSAGAVQISSLA